MVFYFELVELSMNLENIVEKVDKEDKLLKIGLGGSESPLTLWRLEIILEIMVIRLGAWVILIRIRPIGTLGWLKLWYDGLVISKKEVGV